MQRMKIHLLVYSLLWVPTVSYAQSTLTGTVSDGFGLPLIGANVYVEQTFQGAITDLNGEYTIKNLKNGPYVVKASYIGYSTRSEIINLETNTELNFVLDKANIIADEVIISATRARDKSPLAFTNVTKEEIHERNYGQDMPFVLSMTPSMVTSSDAGTGIGYTSFRIRGTDMNRINMTINGIPLNDAESHGVWWVDLPDLASSVDNVQIQRGVGTSTNGAAAFGASMNLQTFTLNRLHYAEVSTHFGSYNTWKRNIAVGTGLIKNKFTFDLRLSGINSDGYIDRAYVDLNSFFIQGAYYSDKSLLKLNIISGTEKTYQAWWGVPSGILATNRKYNPSGMNVNEMGDTVFYDNETDNYWQDHYQLLFSHELDNQWIFNASLHYTYGRGYYEEYMDPEMPLYIYETFVGYGLDDVVIGSDTIRTGDLIREKWLDNDFFGMTCSFNYREGRIDAFLGGGINRYDGRHFGKVIWSRFSGTSEMNHEWYRGTGLKDDANIYAKMTYQATHHLGITGDLQLRYIKHKILGIHWDLRDIQQVHDYTFFNPKVGIHYEFNNIHSMFFSFAMANREPNRSNFVDADENHPVPAYETLYDYELGYKASSSLAKAAATFYYMDYDNQLVLTGEINDVGAAIMTNVKDSYRAGLEIEATIKPLKQAIWDVNLTLSSNKIKKFTEFVDNWSYWDDPDNEPYQYSQTLSNRDLSFSPAVIAGSKVTYEVIDNLKINLLSKYIGKQYIDNTSSEDRKLDPYFVNDLSIQYSFKTSLVNRISLFIHANNIFNEEYETNAWIYRYFYGGEESYLDGYFPQTGRHFMGGVTFRF